MSIFLCGLARLSLAAWGSLPFLEIVQMGWEVGHWKQNFVSMIGHACVTCLYFISTQVACQTTFDFLILTKQKIAMGNEYTQTTT